MLFNLDSLTLLLESSIKVRSELKDIPCRSIVCVVCVFGKSSYDNFVVNSYDGFYEDRVFDGSVSYSDI